MSHAWLLITGAGASRNLGTEQPMALMADWSDELLRALGAVTPGFGEAIGLRKGLNGQDFEERLGAFLTWTRSVPITRTLMALGADTVSDIPAAVERWFQTADHRVSQADAKIHEVLFRLFERSKISVVSAERAYGELFTLLGIGSDDHLIYATTNYDVAGELALHELQRMPDWGELPALGGTPYVNVDKLVDRCPPPRTAVLHLHGRVGWYRDTDGRVISQPPSQPFNTYAGTPALLLPNPSKDYSEWEVVTSLWDQFGQAVRQQTRILVLGHSLHDDELVRILTSRSQREIGVAVLHYESCDNSFVLAETQRVKSLLPGAHVIPMDFGPDLKVDRLSLMAWLNGEAPTFPERRGSA